MRNAGLLAVLAICALPARGESLSQGLSPDEEHTLTPIDTLPTREALNRVLQASSPPTRIARLKEIAQSTEDFGVRLRAIRALPHYCGTLCRSDGVAAGDPVHLALREILDELPPNDFTSRNVLLLRATLEALGATKSGLDEDVAAIAPSLEHPSRDVRIAAARALRDLCNRSALDPLRERYLDEPVEQVWLVISQVVDHLGNCGP